MVFAFFKLLSLSNFIGKELFEIITMIKINEIMITTNILARKNMSSQSKQLMRASELIRLRFHKFLQEWKLYYFIKREKEVCSVRNVYQTQSLPSTMENFVKFHNARLSPLISLIEQTKSLFRSKHLGVANRKGQKPKTTKLSKTVVLF